MKQIIKNYTFDTTAKTIKLPDFTQLSLKQLYLITDVTTNAIIYNFADPTTGATVAGNVITLTNASMAGLANTDNLQIIYESLANDPAFDAQPVAITPDSLRYLTSVMEAILIEAQLHTALLMDLRDLPTRNNQLDY